MSIFWEYENQFAIEPSIINRMIVYFCNINTGDCLDGYAKAKEEIWNERVTGKKIV